MRSTLRTSTTLRTLAAALCALVCLIHLKDQNWLALDKDPRYVLGGYLLLEIGAAVAVVWLLFRPSRAAWLLAAGVALGPLLGYVLSRGPGLPSYRDDIGNWTETIGVLSLFVESALLALSLRVLTSEARTPSTAVAGEGHVTAAERRRDRATID